MFVTSMMIPDQAGCTPTGIGREWQPECRDAETRASKQRLAVAVKVVPNSGRPHRYSAAYLVPSIASPFEARP